MKICLACGCTVEPVAESDTCPHDGEASWGAEVEVKKTRVKKGKPESAPESVEPGDK